MREQEAASILLVRAIEEVDETAFSPELITSALKEAGPNIAQPSWFISRADYLLRHFPEWREIVLSLSRFPDNALTWILFAVFLAGLATNYLGPPGKIHVFYNPIMALVAWNLCLLVFMLLVRFLRPLRRSSPGEGRLPEPEAAESPAPGEATIPTGKEAAQIPLEAASSSTAANRTGAKEIKFPWLLRVIVRPIWEYWVARVMQHRESAADVHRQSRIISRFWAHWSKCARPVILSRWQYLLHLSALFIVLGAIAGMYLRGLVFDYNVIWASTFIKDETSVSSLVNFLLGPAQFVARLLRLELESAIDISKLTSSAGDPAAAWIHLFSMSALVFVVLPRLALALRCRAVTKRLKDRIVVHFDDYFLKTLQSQIGRVICQEASVVGAMFADEIATFVRDRLYDERIVPELRLFRESGGSLNSLKERMRQICETFEPELDSYKDRAVAELEKSLGERIEQMAAGLVTGFRIGGPSGDHILAADRVAGKEVEDAVVSMGRSLTDAAGLAVSASVAVALGTLSGGFGNALGTAILTAILGTTGPAGFLIGAIVGLVVTGAGWWFGRERITQAVEGIELPAAVIQACLWTSKFEDLIAQGRASCYESVKQHISDLMEPLGAKIAEQISIRMAKS